MKISIIIPAYNEEKYIGKTLASIGKLKKKEDWDIEVIVINGGSTDNTVKVAKEYGVRVINEPHKGIGFARQQGLLHAKGEIVAYTDADTIVPEDWLLDHLKILQEKDVVCSYGHFRVIDGKFPYFHYINYIQPYALWICHHVFGKPASPGQNMAFWKDAAQKTGGFDKNLFVMEDVDFTNRMKKIGKVIFRFQNIVTSSGRRSNEGWRFFIRAGGSALKYFLGIKKLPGFPDFR